jgi:hypothetical protein
LPAWGAVEAVYGRTVILHLCALFVSRADLTADGAVLNAGPPKSLRRISSVDATIRARSATQFLQYQYLALSHPLSAEPRPPNTLQALNSPQTSHAVHRKYSAQHHADPRNPEEPIWMLLQVIDQVHSK